MKDNEVFAKTQLCLMVFKVQTSHQREVESKRSTHTYKHRQWESDGFSHTLHCSAGSAEESSTVAEL